VDVDDKDVGVVIKSLLKTITVLQILRRK